jgi:glucan 1,3-beta-glucosidase
MKFLSTALAVLGLVTTMAVSAKSDADADADSTSSRSETKYKHFRALNDTHTCIGDEHALPFNNQIRGVNLGGWMVLEPWITPSLFYQFLNGDETSSAFDMYTYCEVLGPEEANRQLKQHWETWVTPEIIENLAQSGAVNSLRLPVGDFMYKPYGPYGEWL